MRAKRVAPIGLAIPLALVLAVPGGPASSEPATPAQDPTLFLSEPSDAAPEDIAVSFVQEEASSYGLTTADVAGLVVASSYTSEHNEVTHVNVSQGHQGRDIFGAQATVNVTRDGVVLHVAETLVPADVGMGASSVQTDAAQALESASEALGLETPQKSRVLERKGGADRETVLRNDAISSDDIPAQLGWQPTDEGLRPAWQMVIDDPTDVHLWNATVDAQTGELLQADDWTSEDSHATLQATLSRSGTPASSATQTVAADALLPPDQVEDGSSYRVLEFPKESPNDGTRSLVTNPADALSSPFGWHDTDGEPGAEYTITRGNNAHAYTDQDDDGEPDPNGQPDGGPGLEFDFPMDLSEHAQTYRDAAVSNLFYANNVIHDVLYRYGFDEASGNFQVTNYTGEGTGGDDVRAEAADGGGTNNANFATPARDGDRPRMQMYLWPGRQFGMPNAVTLGSGEQAQSYGANYARFTPAPTNAGFDGEVVQVDDGEGTAGDGCTAYTVPGGAIALMVDSDACDAHTQVTNAEAAGAVAAVVAYDSENAPIMSGTMDPAVGLPAASITQADAAAIRAQLADGISAGSVHKSESHPGIRDGDLENGIIIHEYGHGVSNRLTGGLNINCLRGDEQMGEGWSDFLAIGMLMDPALDDPEEARGMGPYALYQDDRSGDGIRPAPYSRSMDIQPFTYDRIRTGGWVDGSTLSRPHGVGHAWAATLWDLSWDLVDRYGFNADIYGDWDSGGNNRALQYVIDGLKMQGCEPGFIDGRDGILAAEAALGGDDNCLIWSTFARRGMGHSAEQGTTDRDDNTEAFDVPPWCAAPGDGVIEPNGNQAPELDEVSAGSNTPVFFDLGGDLGLDILKPNHSPASQEIDCATLEPVQYATTAPSDSPGNSGLKYNRGQQRYHYNWKTEADWAGTCRQLIITLEDGTQHRANYEFAARD